MFNIFKQFIVIGLPVTGRSRKKTKQNRCNMAMQLKYIEDHVVRRLLTWDRLLPVVRQSLAAFSRGALHPRGAVQPLRSSVTVDQHQGTMLVMPGLVKGEATHGGALATKIVSLFPGNSQKGLSTHHALVVLMEPSTGAPLAILEGEAITELRTAAASAVATIELANGRLSEAEGGTGGVVAVLGAGTQGRAHARVMAHVFKPREVRIWSRTPASAETLASVLHSEGIPAVAAPSVREAVADADVINTCTLSTTPILRAEWVKAGAHVNSVGAPRPDWQEMEEQLVRSSSVYADSREAATKEAGDVIKAGAEVVAEIGEVLLGSRPALRDNTTIFKSLGLAVEDAVTARLVYDLVMKEEEEQVNRRE
ncbi:ketimine reductase mu-crystallin-like isoform X2 [Penaeus japonicus]|uniref:ketimine reductase mu-crystallin-like isoform X2 n=2 Tax=Penaeus japonicus TaxID=27405 RepID=UPI001C7155DF|nr:ketimine reductase mu-crystallin-like isoform X2 [Penaeus japonicus]